MENNKIIIFGGGETAILAYEYFTHDSPYQVVAFAMDKEFIKESEIMGVEVLDIEATILRYPPEKYNAFVATSSTKLNRVRLELYHRAKDLGYQLVSYISSKAFVWKNVELGDNCFILEDNTLQPFTKIGNNVVMWSGNHLGHRSEIRDNCFISSHCVISGYCIVEKNCFLGVNCTLENNSTVSQDSFVGAGAIVRKHTSEKAFLQEPATEEAKVNSYKVFKIKE